MNPHTLWFPELELELRCNNAEGNFCDKDPRVRTETIGQKNIQLTRPYVTAIKLKKD